METFKPDFDNVESLHDQVHRGVIDKVAKETNDLIERQLKLSLIAKGIEMTYVELIRAARDKRLVKYEYVSQPALMRITVYEIDGQPIMQHEMHSEINLGSVTVKNIFKIL